MRYRLLAVSAARLLLLGAVAVSLIPAAVEAQAVPRRRQARGAAASPDDLAARRLLERARELLAVREHDRGTRMLQTIIDQYPQSQTSYHAHLELGKHYLETRRESEAIRQFHELQRLKQTETNLEGELLEIYLQSLYYTGLAYFQTRQYGAVFPVLRMITRDYPNTIWANQSYYYIGMCHFAQENWNKAIEALSLVGTFVDPEAVAVEYIEAGQRIYIKVTDPDMPVMTRLGRDVKVSVESSGGDRETVELLPLSRTSDTYIGSIELELGKANIGDDIVQAYGGEEIIVNYIDENTEGGERNVRRLSRSRVVSTGSLAFTLGTYEGEAAAAFLGQPLYILGRDADLSTSDAADSMTVRAVVRYKANDEDADAVDPRTGGVDISALLRSSQEQWQIRDEVVLELKELGNAPVRSGRFGGSVMITELPEGQEADRTDNVLSCRMGDEIVVTYVDHLHINGTSPREVVQIIPVGGEIDSSPRASQNVVTDPLVRARKHLVEGRAYLELGRIFRSMGLMDGARERCDVGIKLVDEVLQSSDVVPPNYMQQAFQLKWNLLIVKGDYENAIRVCHSFNQLYPESPLVDEALMQIANSFMEQREFDRAVMVYNSILRLPASLAKAEAQFRIAEITERIEEAKGERGNPNLAIPLYKRCADNYPNSEFAGQSLAKLIDYYVNTRDYVMADDLLEQVFQDYPDADFLDSMLMKWTIVSFRRGNFAKAQEKCQRLLFDYPSSRFATMAKQILPTIEARLK